MKLTPGKLQNYALTAALAGGTLLVLYVAIKGVKGATKDVVSGVVGGAVDVVGGALEGAYEALPTDKAVSGINSAISNNSARVDSVASQLPFTPWWWKSQLGL